MTVTVIASVALISVALGWLLHHVQVRPTVAQLRSEVEDLEARLEGSMDSPVLRDWSASVAQIQRQLPR